MRTGTTAAPSEGGDGVRVEGPQELETAAPEAAGDP